MFVCITRLDSRDVGKIWNNSENVYRSYKIFTTNMYLH